MKIIIIGILLIGVLLISGCVKNEAEAIAKQYIEQENQNFIELHNLTDKIEYKVTPLKSCKRFGDWIVKVKNIREAKDGSEKVEFTEWVFIDETTSEIKEIFIEERQTIPQTRDFCKEY